MYSNTSPKIPLDFQNINYSIMNLWEFCVYSVFFTGITENLRPITG